MDPPPDDGDEIVISGLSGRYSEAANIHEFWDKLMAGKELTSIDDRRWPVDYFKLPHKSGKIPNIEKFDASFFNIPDWEANWMDVQLRLFHETTYEAMWDSGIDPYQFDGTRTGVYFGLCNSDTDVAYRQDEQRVSRYIQLAATRLSTAFKFKGPCLTTDTACASSFTAMHAAFSAIKAGIIDSAIVGGLNINLRPGLAGCFNELKMISKDGKSKCMDESADGYCRSEAIVSIFLTKKRFSKRNYCYVANARTNCDGFKQEGITFPSIDLQTQLMRETYGEINLNPEEVTYVEAHMTGTAAGDPVESAALASVLCPDNRKDPLLIGCVKSNMGHSEGASGVCAITKSALVLQKREIPPNIHFVTPNPNIESLISGRLKPVLSKQAFSGNYIGVNCFGFGGCNVHVIMKANEKNLNDKSRQITYHKSGSHINRLITFCGRTQDMISELENMIKTKPDDITADFCYLVNQVSKINPEYGMIHRSYFVLDENRNILSKNDIKIEDIKPVVIILSDTPPMEATFEQFMKFDIFSKSMNELFDISKLFAGNLKTEEMKNFSKIFELVSFHISLIDLLSGLSIKPDFIIGLSYGEISAAYADNCLTKKQVILICVKIAIILSDKNINGNKLSALKSLLRGCADLTQITNKERSSRWLSTVIPISDWHQNTTLSYNYFGQIIISKSNLDQVFDYLPKNSLILQLSPPSTPNFDQLIRFNMGPDVRYIEFVDYDQDKNREFTNDDILSTLGEIYLTGIFVDTCALYEKVTLPVARETASLSPIFRWNHDKNYIVTKLPDYFNITKSKAIIHFDYMDPKLQYIYGHKIDGRYLIPATGYLCMVWDNYAAHQGYLDGDGGTFFHQVAVEFTNVAFHRATILTKTSSVALDVQILTSSGRFCISEGGAVCVTGYIRICNNDPSTADLEEIIHQNIKTEEDNIADQTKDDLDDQDKDAITLQTADIYKEFRIRGYDYGDTFQGLQSITSYDNYTRAVAKWNGSWVAFSDSMLQMGIIADDNRQLMLPTGMDYLKCDIKTLMHEVKQGDNPGYIDVTFDKIGKIGGCKGLVIKGLSVTPVPRRMNQDPLIEQFTFSPNFDLITDQESDKILNTYHNECLQLFNDKFGSAQKSNSNLPDDNLSKNENAILLKILKDSKDNFEFSQKIKSQDNDLMKDLLLITSDMEIMIRSHVDIFLENSSLSRAEIFDVNNFSNLITSQIFALIDANNVSPNLLQSSKDESGNVKLPKHQLNSDLLLLQHPSYQFSFCNQDQDQDKDQNQYQDKDQDKDDFDKILTQSIEIMKPGAFLLLSGRAKNWPIENLIKNLVINNNNQDNNQSGKNLNVKNLIDRVDKLGCKTISLKEDKSSDLISIMFRKPNPKCEIEIIPIGIDNYDWVDQIKDKIKIPDIKIWLVADDSPSNGIIGLVKTLRKEDGGSKIRAIFDLDHDNKIRKKSYLKNIPQDLIDKDLTINVIKNKSCGTYRHQVLKNYKCNQDSKDAYLDIATKGDLSSLRYYSSQNSDLSLDFIESKFKQKNDNLMKDLKSDMEDLATDNEKGNQIRLKKYDINFAALNFKDVMVSSGRIPLNAYPAAMTDGNLGMEFSGIDSKSKNRTMGMTQINAIATSVITPDLLTWNVPDHMSLQDAATIPVAYSTAYYALITRGKLSRGESILIHAGTGGVGQAAIHVAMSLNCNIFTTVGTAEKIDFIKKHFPSIPTCQILNSRDTSFETKIMQITNGIGVNVVLNSLAEDKLKASLRCLSDRGRFLEIGKYDIITNNKLDLSDFYDNKSFQVICLAHLIHESFVDQNDKSISEVKEMKRLVAEGIDNGVVKPLINHVFDLDKSEEAFRFMASGKHMGKVLIKIKDEDENNNQDNDPRAHLTINSEMKTYFDPQKSYIVTGGLGGFGLELAHWLIERGARNLILTSRSGIKNSYQKLVLRRMKDKYDAKVKISNYDITNYEQTQNLINESSEMAPIGGIFHLAMILKDNLLENQTPELFETICAPKIIGTKNLDILSRSHSDIKYFVCFSSLAAGRGNTGQANYSFANSGMEKIVEERHQAGFPALAIQWGPIGDVGVVAETMGGNDIELLGTVPQRLPSCFKLLDSILSNPNLPPIISSLILSNSTTSSKDDPLKVIFHILGIKDQTTVDPQSTLLDLGMDSLMAIEIKQGLERDYNVILTSQEVRQLKVIDIQNFKKKHGDKKLSSPTKLQTITDHDKDAPNLIIG